MRLALDVKNDTDDVLIVYSSDLRCIEHDPNSQVEAVNYASQAEAELEAVAFMGPCYRNRSPGSLPPRRRSVVFSRQGLGRGHLRQPVILARYLPDMNGRQRKTL